MTRFITEWWYLIAAGLIVLALAMWLGFAATRENDAHRGIATSWSLLIALVAAPIAIAAVGAGKADDLWDLYLVFLGGVLLLAFFRPQQAFVLRGLQCMVEVVFFPRSKVWLLGLGALFVAVGVYGLARRIAV